MAKPPKDSGCKPNRSSKNCKEEGKETRGKGEGHTISKRTQGKKGGKKGGLETNKRKHTENRSHVFPF